MTNQKHTCIVATIHDDYLIEELSNHYYTPAPKDRGCDGVYVTPVLNGSVIEIDALPQDLVAKLSPYVRKFFDPEQDYNTLIYYHIMCIGGEEVMREFLQRCVTTMCQRIDDGVLEHEDDHYDFFHSTMELLVQIALEWGLIQKLRPLQQCIVDNHAPHCEFDDTCWLPSILAPYL